MFDWIRRRRRTIVTAGILFLAGMMVLSAIPTFTLSGQAGGRVVAARAVVKAKIVRDYQVSIVRALVVPKRGVSEEELRKAVEGVESVERVSVQKTKIKGYEVYVVDALVPSTVDPNQAKRDVERVLKGKAMAERSAVVKGSVFLFQASYDGRPDKRRVEEAVRRELGNRVMDGPSVKVRYNSVVGRVLCNVSDGKHVEVKRRIERALRKTGARGCLVLEQLTVRLGRVRVDLLGPGEEKVGTRTVNFSGRTVPAMVLPEHARQGEVGLWFWMSTSGGRQRVFLVDQSVVQGHYTVF
ncbi:MAG: hypothetical protein ABGY09_03905 [Euryarchaeota archaeon]